MERNSPKGPIKAPFDGLPIGADVYSICDDDELDEIVQEILQESPESGEVYVDGALAFQGFRVQRRRLRQSLRRIDPVNRSLRRSFAIVRRQYRVAGPNALW